MTVEEMRQRMSTNEFTHWWIYYQRIAQRRELEERRAKHVGS